ncbi:MAG: tyrosine--tRNA ligase, partial [Acidimicrobiia bacterium]|nr:tyrosine--tRNA ligase [Acidimicrobiia bacterium]
RPEEQLTHLLRGVDTVVPDDELADRLAEGRPLRVKLGLDPTAPSVTLGWAVVLRKLRHFQEMGHTAVLIVGDFTAQVGDPSGKSETRQRLTAAEVRGYAETVLSEFEKVLLPDPLEIRYNSEWLGGLDMAEVLELTSKVTVAQMLERDDFRKRFTAQQPISVMEFMYPLLQGYDSIAVEADIELGGADQLWNLMMGRVLQERYGQRPQLAMTMPLLIGTDGEQKMSQSLDNYIGVSDDPAEMFGKVMSIPDHLMAQWFELATAVPEEEIVVLMEGLASGDEHPGEVKRMLGRTIVELYHGGDAGPAAEAAFDQVFKQGGVPDDVDVFRLPDDDPVWLPGLMAAAGLVSSNSEGRRMISQGAVKVDGTRIDDEEIGRSRLIGTVLQVGKRRFVELAG